MAGLVRNVLFRLATQPALERVVRATAAGEAAAWRFARRYVAGPDVDTGIALAGEFAGQGVGTSIDIFGEQVSDPGVVEQVVAGYQDLARRVAAMPPSVWLSVDLSHIGLDLSVAYCRTQLMRIAVALTHGRFLQVGAEDTARADGVLAVVLEAAAAGAPVMATVQANLRRSGQDVRRLAGAGVPVRLVKGAYVEPPHLALPWGTATDTAYLRLAHQLRDSSARLALATHDRRLREHLLSEFGPTSCEVLLGVGHDDATELTGRGCPVRVYLPCGPGWFRYAMRRAAEARGA